jgi:hypothetical protein
VKALLQRSIEARSRLANENLCSESASLAEGEQNPAHQRSPARANTTSR